MAFSMHSHSGQFCPGHAKDQLEAIVQRAIELHMRMFAVTEHMPRTEVKDLYPEERGSGSPLSSHQVAANETIVSHRPRHEAYIQEAVRLRAKYQDRIPLLIGFEAEWIRPAYAPLIRELARDPNVDFFLGSVHHVHEIPIDYDPATYRRARAAAGGNDERLFEDYYDAQYEMLQALSPPVVGHFDVIRLLSDEPDADIRSAPEVWAKVLRNLKLIRAQGGLLEINSSALRKGLKEPYPVRCICKEFIRLGGKFTLSDDSHGIAQVGLNFGPSTAYLKSLGVEEVYYLERDPKYSQTQLRPPLVERSVALSEINVDEYPCTT
ncbi:MAG: histidinolphosphatase [Claussenomyces sp. TS43310]|nr:MAG: histidinolphosphatase [Claussenomyces sp. TS43310]